MSDLCFLCPMPGYCQTQGRCDRAMEGERLNFMVTRARELERERCAAICEAVAAQWANCHQVAPAAARQCADEIRRNRP